MEFSHFSGEYSCAASVVYYQLYLLQIFTVNHKLTWIIAFFAFPSILFSQQEPATTQFWNTYLYSNPATAGLFNRISVSTLFQNQWAGVTGAPADIFANGSARINAIRGGAGLSYLYDQTGHNKSSTLTASYAFHFQLAHGRRLSIGIAGGIKQIRLQSKWIPPVTMYDPALPHGGTKAAFDANFGLAYADSNFRAGVSMTNLNAPMVRSGIIAYSIARYVWAFAEYDFHLRKVTLTPRIGGITDFNQLTFSASVMAMINNRFWFGANYMYQNSVGLMIGCDFYGKYRIGYSYDYTINKLNTYSQGTHEVVLAFILK